jgi:hypothetical protein
MGETWARFRDYAGLGAPLIIQMDPENYVAHRFESGSLLETHFRELSVKHSGIERFQRQISIPFDSDALFDQLRTELAEAGER